MTKLILNWNNAGTLNDIKKIDDQCAVYVFVYSGNPKRIIYVGTSTTQQQRWKDERGQLLDGLGTVFRVQENADIYDLMCYKDKGDPIEYYKKLASASPPILWVPITGEKINILNREDNYDVNWKSYISDFYIKHIEIWYSSVPTKEIAEIVETLLQCRISSKHMIGYYTDKQIRKGQTWLGQPEVMIKSQGLPDDLSACFVEM